MEKIVDSIYKLIQIASGDDIANIVLSISDEAKIAFFNILEEEKQPKGAILNLPGKSTKNVYFIYEGLLISTMQVEGKEIGMGFFAEGGIGGDLISFLSQRKSERTVKVLENAHLFKINFDELENLYKIYPEIQQIGRLLYNYVFIILQERIEGLVLESANMRYESFKNKFPTIHHRLPLNFTSSFLGITQETLSRIRNKN
ncbi:MAG: Crp/Fnr family transcriptional regulator [Flavobacteriia bacterium]|nr:Crp/Fnr family transcriptional regulator [Flavobacteriia bacterium]